MSVAGDAYDDDVACARDLGLVAPKSPQRIANPIYREVIVRVLGLAVEDNVDLDPLRPRREALPRLRA